MATINSQIILSGAGITSEPLLINHTSTLVVRNPAIESGTLNVTTTAATLVPTNASKVYLYARNTGAINTADSINIKTIGGTNIIELAPSDWCFLPIEQNLGLDVESVTASGISTIEFSYFTAA